MRTVFTYQKVDKLSAEESIAEKYADLCEEDKAYEMSKEVQDYRNYNYNAGLNEFGRQAISYIVNSKKTYLKLLLYNGVLGGDKHRIHEYGKRVMEQANRKRDELEEAMLATAEKDGKLGKDFMLNWTTRQTIKDTVKEIVLNDVVNNDDNAEAILLDMEAEEETKTN